MSQPLGDSPSSPKACDTHIPLNCPSTIVENDDPSMSLLLPSSSKPDQTPTHLSQSSSSPSSAAAAARGYLFVILAGFFFACDSNVERYVQVTALLSYSSLIFLDGAIVTLLSLLYLLLFPGLFCTLRKLSVNDVKNLFLQGIVGAGTLVCLTVAFKHLPSGIALSIFYTNPILAVLVARIILGERVTRAAVIALILAVIGAMLVTNNPSSTSSSPSVGDNTTYGLLLAFCGALFGAFIPLHTRILMTDYRNHNDNSEDLCFMLPSLSVGIVGTCIGLVLRGYVSPQSLIGDGVANMIWKMMPGTLVLLAQSMIGKGFQLCDAGTGAIMMTMELPMAFAIQTIVLGERSSMGCSIGALLLLMSAVTVAVSKVFVETLE